MPNSPNADEWLTYCRNITYYTLLQRNTSLIFTKAITCLQRISSLIVICNLKIKLNGRQDETLFQHQIMCLCYICDRFEFSIFFFLMNWKTCPNYTWLQSKREYNLLTKESEKKVIFFSQVDQNLIIQIHNT